MDYNEIVEVQHICLEEDVNRLLRDGWVILATEPGRYEEGGAYILYSMGRKRDEGEGVI